MNRKKSFLVLIFIFFSDENTTRYRWDGSEIIGESGYDTAVYYRGLNLIAHIKEGATSYYVFNAHGDTVGLTQGTEALKTNCAYSAFGEYSYLQGTPFRYNGQYYDTESGLYYLRNRYYDPTIGRFTQEDPVKSGLNWYVYCNNNPVKFCDIFGLEAVLLREEAQRLGAVVKYDEVNRCAIIDFGYYGGYKYFTMNKYDNDGAYGLLIETENKEIYTVAMIEKGVIERDFGIVDNTYYWDKKNGNYVTVSLFDEGSDGYYQRIAINGASITWESVGYSNFNKFGIGRYDLSAGNIWGYYVDRENGQMIKDLLSVLEAYPVDFHGSDYFSLASYFYGMYGYIPEYRVFENYYQILFRNKVYFLDGNMNYKYSAKE